MRRAIGLAGKVPDLSFGTVIVDRDTGTILSEGWNRTSVNPTWHGEIDAINTLASSGVCVNGTSLVLYTTAEPCPMCQAAILWTGIETVVFGTLSLPNNGGFASVRSKPGKLDLEKGDTLVAKVRGDGREYTLNLYPARSRTAFSYRATVQTKKDEWIKVERAASPK